MESIVLRIPGNCKKLSESRVSGAAHHSLCPGTSLLFLRQRCREQQTGQQQMGTSQTVSPGLIPVPVCKTGCVDDPNLGKENHHTISELCFLCLGSSPAREHSFTFYEHRTDVMIQGYSIYNLLLLGHKVAPCSFSVCFSTLVRVIAVFQIYTRFTTSFQLLIERILQMQGFVAKSKLFYGISVFS